MLIRTDIKLSDHLLTTFSCLHDPEIMRIIKTCQLRLLEKLIASKHTVKFQVLKTILSPVLFNVTDYPKLSIYLDNYGFPEGAENLQCIEE